MTLFGSSLWWIERWTRRADADAAGVSLPDIPHDHGYHRDNAITRLDRVDDLLAAARPTVS